jgi:hypothetical protein
MGQGSQTHGPPSLFCRAFSLISFHLWNLARLRVEDILKLRCSSSRALRLKKLCYPRMVTYREFSYRGTEYGRAGTVIHASAVIYVVRSTARSPELTRYSQDLVGYLTSGYRRRSLCSSPDIGRWEESVSGFHTWLGTLCNVHQQMCNTAVVLNSLVVIYSDFVTQKYRVFIIMCFNFSIMPALVITFSDVWIALNFKIICFAHALISVWGHRCR